MDAAARRQIASAVEDPVLLDERLESQGATEFKTCQDRYVFRLSSGFWTSTDSIWRTKGGNETFSDDSPLRPSPVKNLCQSTPGFNEINSGTVYLW